MSTKKKVKKSTATSTVDTAPAKTSKSGKSSKDKALTDKNVGTVAEESKDAAGRDLKYRYPEDVKTGADKKTFRRRMRAERDRLDKKIRALKKSKEEGAAAEAEKAQKEFDRWVKNTISEGHTPFKVN